MREIKKKASKMGHQEAFDIIYRISDNSHHEPQQEAFINGVFVEISLMVHGDITARLTTRSGNKSKARKSQFTLIILQPMQ